MTELTGTAVNAKLVPEAASAASLSSPLQRSWGHSCANVRIRPLTPPPSVSTLASGAAEVIRLEDVQMRSSTARLAALDSTAILCTAASALSCAPP